MKLKVEQRKIQIIDEPTLVSGTISYQLEFSFDTMWDGYAKTAVILLQDNKTTEIPLNNGTGTLPWEVLVPNTFIKIGVYGTLESNRLGTFYTRPVYVAPGPVPQEPIPDPTPEVYDQILEIANSANEKVLTLETVINNKEFVPVIESEETDVNLSAEPFTMYIYGEISNLELEFIVPEAITTMQKYMVAFTAKVGLTLQLPTNVVKPQHFIILPGVKYILTFVRVRDEYWMTVNSFGEPTEDNMFGYYDENGTWVPMYRPDSAPPPRPLPPDDIHHGLDNP